jgi:DNA-binding transcriptional MerR regulator
MATPTYSIGAVARLAGVTVRTLHHYDRIGLLSPGARSASGYRRYGADDIERLQRVLFYRELGFALDEIKVVMADRTSPSLAHLRRQHRLLKERIGRLDRMVAGVEKAMEASAMNIPLTAEERLQLFGDVDAEALQAEAEERWGDTDAHRESSRRAAAYTPADWARHKAENVAVTQRLISALQAGLAPGSPDAMAAAEAHRQLISVWFYPCSLEMHVGLAEGYVSDPRFTATYEKLAPGLAQFVHDAIVANAARQGSAT